MPVLNHCLRARRWTRSALLLALLGLLPGCRSDLEQRHLGTPSPRDARPLVLTSFTVLADLANNVAGERLQVRSITRQGAEIHGYEPTPSDIQAAQGADLILMNGLGLERWAERFLAAAGSDVPTAILSQGITPLLIEADRDAGKPNPHAWMSPRRAQVYVDRIVEAFSRLDPAGGAIYRRNGSRYKQQLQLLDATLARSLARVPPSRRLLVSCEGAFSYLARDYGLQEAYLWPVNSENQITPRRMAGLIRSVRQRRIPAVFCESTVNDEAQREVARAAGARFGGTFFVDSLSLPSGPAPTLLKLQRHNVDLIIQGLAGTAPQP